VTRVRVAPFFAVQIVKSYKNLLEASLHIPSSGAIHARSARSRFCTNHRALQIAPQAAAAKRPAREYAFNLTRSV